MHLEKAVREEEPLEAEAAVPGLAEEAEVEVLQVKAGVPQQLVLQEADEPQWPLCRSSWQP